MIAEMDNGKLAYVAADSAIGQPVSIWCVRTGQMWTGTIVRFVA